MTIHFFGPDRTLLCTPRTEWAVVITDTDQAHDQPTAEMALMYAADYNAEAAQLAANDPDGRMPISHAVVTRNGYAWSADIEHRAGRDCGIQACIHCDTDRRTAAAQAGSAA